MSLRVSLAVLLSLSVACGGGDDDDDDDDDVVTVDAAGNGGDASPTIDSAPGIPDATVCHVLANTAPVIERTMVVGDVPSATGGTIPDGTYHLVADTIYVTSDPGGTGIMRQKTTQELPGTGVDTVVTFEDGDERSSFDSMISGTTITYTATCGPGSDSPAVPFTVIEGETTQLLLIANPRVETYELQ